MNKGYFALLALLLFLACGQEQNPKSDVPNQEKGKQAKATKKDQQVFELLTAAQSGVDFSNTLSDNLATKENLFDYDFFYNGSGVGIADLDNDGLLDLVFTGNQVPNRIYKNKGELKFEDVSENSGLNIGKKWASGVTFADVNNDGLLDIYICQGGPYDKELRRNKLFLNKGEMQFEEKAAELGLDDPGISTQAAFFDFDKDGDLDCVVSNENSLYGLDPVRFHQVLKSNPGLLEESTVNLYENKGGSFTKITKQAGLLRPAFGLGLIVADIDEDGWQDIYVANDYYIPDVMYINNGDGTFSDQIKERTKQISFYGMGVDIEDLDNDSHQDIYVLDMAANDHVRSKTLMASMNVSRFSLLTNELEYQSQYMYNSLQLNVGNNHFQNIAQFSKVAKTDWSWAGLMMDFNNDEQKEIYVTNGYRRYALDNDFQIKVRNTQRQYNGNVPLQVKEDLYYQMPSEKLSNLLYEGDGALNFKDKAGYWGLRHPSFSNGAAYGDLDGDGDLELVVNNIDQEAFVYQNLSVEKKLGNYLNVKAQGKSSEHFAKIWLKYNGKQQFFESKRVKGYLSATDDLAHFGLGDLEQIDTVRVVWPSGKMEERYEVAANQLLVFTEAEANQNFKKEKTAKRFVASKTNGIDFKHKENSFNDFEREVLLPYKQSSLGPLMSSADLNGDGKDDLYIGGATGQAGSLYLSTPSGYRSKSGSTFAADADCEDMASVFFDYDGDGDLDLYVVSGGNSKPFPNEAYQDRIYLNDGKGNFTKDEQTDLSPTVFSGKAVASIDFDGDGDLDLLVSNRIMPQNYPKSPPNVLFRNDGGKLVDVTEETAASFATFGMVNSIQVTDFNKDGKQDFIALGEWTSIGLFENKGGRFENAAEGTSLEQQKGWWFKVLETDLNNDGWPDYVLGNVGKNIKFKASQEDPFKIFANDFDDNGTLDVVLSSKYNGDYVPARGRECSSQQMPFITEKFKTYGDFANATLVDVYGDDKLENSVSLEATEFKSMVMINQKGNGFALQALPEKAQYFPMMDLILLDVNADGFQDLIAVGNIYDTEVETPRLDAGNGLVLLSNQQENYKPLTWREAGLFVDGDVKSAIGLRDSKGLMLLFGRNNKSMAAFRLNR